MDNAVPRYQRTLEELGRRHPIRRPANYNADAGARRDYFEAINLRERFWPPLPEPESDDYYYYDDGGCC